MSKLQRIALFLGIAMVVTVLISACGGTSGGNGTTNTSSCPSISGMTGAGSTFDNPLFSKMFSPSAFPASKCGFNVNYQAVGSGSGINDLLTNIVQFGATDAPMTDAQLAQSTQRTSHSCCGDAGRGCIVL